MMDLIEHRVKRKTLIFCIFYLLGNLRTSQTKGNRTVITNLSPMSFVQKSQRFHLRTLHKTMNGSHWQSGWEINKWGISKVWPATYASCTTIGWPWWTRISCKMGMNSGQYPVSSSSTSSALNLLRPAYITKKKEKKKKKNLRNENSIL